MRFLRRRMGSRFRTHRRKRTLRKHRQVGGHLLLRPTSRRSRRPLDGEGAGYLTSRPPSVCLAVLSESVGKRLLAL